MKRLVLIFAIGVLSVQGIQVYASAAPHVAGHYLIKDKLEIAAQDLPKAIKETIENDNTIKEMTISKAYQVTDENGKVHYETYFGEGEEKTIKKFDTKGNELD